MPCLLALLALISPRLALFAIWLFTNLLRRAFEEWWIPLIGFYILPSTTLADAVMWTAGTAGVHDFEWFIVGIAFIADLSSFGASRRYRRD
jgi:hypothetical protein